MKYDWILFDADGTLYDFDKAAEYALEATFSQFGFAWEKALWPVYQQINKEAWEQYERGEIDAAALKPLRFKRLLDRLGYQADLDRFSHDYLDHLSENSDLLDGADALINSLKGNINMMIITNGFKQVQRPRFERSHLRPMFSDLVISDEVGAVKPDPKIFDVAFEKMGQPAKEKVIIIGDSLSSDMTGGIRYGIDTCWFNPLEKANPQNLPITHIIQDLAAFPEKLV